LAHPLNIAVMLGGPSAEREVSLRSGRGVVNALRSLGHVVTEVDPKDETFALPAETQVVFLALHGTFGEDGTVQRKLEDLGVPYTGCDPEASRIGFDKILTKERFAAAGVSTARFAVLDTSSTSWPMGWDPPVVLKPARQGSSVGLQFVERVVDWSRALAETLRYDSTVLMEEKIAGRETTVGILEGKALPVVEIRTKTGINDYATKYTAGTSDYLCPAPFDEETTQRIQAAAEAAFKAIGARDYSRVDVMVRPDGTPMVLEVNTLPGMTELSLFPKAAAAVGLDYAQLCQRMIDLALCRAKDSQQERIKA
jgi:D-alanine-D-alanine ligase